MATEIKVPQLGESVSEATVAQWLKHVGDSVKKDEPVAELETDKVTLEVPAPADGTLTQILAEAETDVEVGALLGYVGAAEEAAAGGGGAAAAEKKPAEPAGAPAEPEKPAAAAKPAEAAKGGDQETAPASGGGQQVRGGGESYSPAVRRLLDEHNLDPSQITGSGKDGRLTKADVEAHIAGKDTGKAAEQPAAAPEPAPAKQEAATTSEAPAKQASPAPTPSASESASGTGGAPVEERVRMTRLRRRIAQRLKDAQNTAAMLTTFNEVDLTELMAVRAKHKDAFEKKHGVKLGFMGFFTKAVVAALKEIPEINASIEGEEIVYKNRYDIGVAVSTPQGLVVPVIRGCDGLSLPEIEQAIVEKGKRARDGKLTLEEMTDGTFTISNGGVFGSLLSMPILNMPQSGILGMHKIQDRPMAVNGKVEIRSMMYLALSYDHRIVDGREAVTFLVRIKESLESPERLMLGL